MAIKTIEQEAYIMAADTPASMPGEWESYFSLIAALDLPMDFMDNRHALLPPAKGDY